jgi:hypothetical protein
MTKTKRLDLNSQQMLSGILTKADIKAGTMRLAWYLGFIGLHNDSNLLSSTLCSVYMNPQIDVSLQVGVEEL